MEETLAYQVLRLESGATRAEIEASYRQLLGLSNAELQSAPASEGSRLANMLYALEEARKTALAAAPAGVTTGGVDESFEAIADGLRSEDRDVRMATVQRISEFDDPRVVKVLEALVNDPDPAIAQRACDERILRTGEAIAQKSAAPDLGQIGVFGSCWAALRIMGQYPGAVLKVAAFNGIAVMLIMFLLSIVMMLFGACIGLLVALVAGSSAAGCAMFAMVTTMMALLYMQIPSFAAGLLAWAIGRLYQHEPVTLGDSIGFVMRRIGPLFRTSIHRSWLLLKPVLATGIAAGAMALAMGPSGRALSFLPLAIGAVCVAVTFLRYMLADIACVIGGLSGAAACERSRVLWLKYSGSIFGYLVTIAIVQVVSSGLLNLVHIDRGLGVLLSFTWGIVLGTWMALTQVVLFYDLCARERLERQG